MKSVAQAQKAEKNASRRVVARTVESAMKTLSSANAHRDGLAMCALTDANQVATVLTALKRASALMEQIVIM